MYDLSYGSHPERLDDLLDGLSPEQRQRVRLLDATENESVEERSVDRFPHTSEGTLGWDGADVLRQERVHTVLDAAQSLVAWLDDHVSPDSELVVLWGNYVVPSLALPTSVLVTHVDEVLVTSSDVWIYAEREKLLFEYFHGGRLTLAKVA
ncbi:hypothetical protein [Streptomyces sp. ODS05-4]|uniref:CDI toxin immunity protein n=1 Tax=Streptomyces sp. ODS05-4 TaxID=2944939 RepID=UPI002108C5B6|nr:hypothetical protein [Streptomyces sp. ODS05-4]